MKIKINKEQVNYLNSLEDTETKKQFLLDCFIEQCEASLDEEEHIVINNPESGNYIPKHKGSITFMFDKPIGDREKFDKFIEDNGLKKFTPVKPKDVQKYIIEYIGRPSLSPESFFEEVQKTMKFYSNELLKEFIDYKPPHPDDVKKYSKKDLEYAFNRSRYKGHFGGYTFDNFEDYIKHNI